LFAMVQDGNSWSVEISGTSISVGTFIYEIRAIDKAGNATPFIRDTAWTFQVLVVC